MNISVEKITFTYPGDVTALCEVSLSVESGQAVAIVGENGAGKTTLVKHLNGLLRPAQGRILLDGADIAEQTVAQITHRVGYVFQNPDDQLFERKVWNEVAFGPRNLGLPDEQVRLRVDEALSQVGLSDFADQHPYDLHIARRKLIALAATLAMHTPVLILDEPTTGQDAAGLALLADIIKLLKEEGRTLIAISHDIDFCVENFDRLVVMTQGMVVADGPIDTVLAQEDALILAGVEPPQLVRLARALGWSERPCSINDFVRLLGK